MYVSLRRDGGDPLAENRLWLHVLHHAPLCCTSSCPAEYLANKLDKGAAWDAMVYTKSKSEEGLLALPVSS